MNGTTFRLATPEENSAFNSASAVAYREATTGQVVNLCQGDFEMLEDCREDFVLPQDFHSGLVDNFLRALDTTDIDMHVFWQTEPEDRSLQFELIPNFLEPVDGKEVSVDSIRVTHGNVVVAHFVPFNLLPTA